MTNQLTSDQLASFHCSRPEPLEPPTDTLVIAEREHVYGSFVARYKDASVLLKQKILREVFYDFADAMTMLYAVENSEILRLLLQEARSALGDLAYLAIQSCDRVCRERRGRVRFIELEGLDVLKQLFYKEHGDIRVMVYHCLEELALDEAILPVLYDAGFFTLVCRRLAEEPFDAHLQSLNRTLGSFLLMNGVTARALEHQVEDSLVANCQKASRQVASLSTKNLLYITYTTQGKLAIVEKSIHRTLAQLYKLAEVDKVVFMEFFGSVAQITGAKKDLVELGFVDEALKFIDTKGPADLVLASLLLLTSLSEYGNQRHLLKQHLETIEVLRYHEDYELLGDYVEDLIQTINWAP